MWLGNEFNTADRTTARCRELQTEVIIWMKLIGNKFYMHGSVHRESNLITVQQDATYSVYYISVGSSTCFGRWHPSSGAGTTVITASGID